MFEHEESELLDVVNEHDEVVDSIHRGDMMRLRDTPGRFLRIVEIFLQRANEDIYLPRRSPKKKLFPSSLDLSAAGHINRSESYEQALLRETREELGIDTTAKDFALMRTIAPSEELFYFRKVYLLRSDQVPTLSTEHTEAIWIAPDNLLAFVRADVPAKDTVYENIPILLEFLQRETQRQSPES